MQLLIQGYSGSSRLLNLPASATAADAKALVEAWEGTPRHLQLLEAGGRLVDDDGEPLSALLETGGAAVAGPLFADGPSAFGLIRVRLRVLGGKGGFGANLRAAGKHKTVDNYDACRDLQGRRIRAKRAEATLAAWQAEAPQRELERAALRYAREQARAEGRLEAAVVDPTELRREADETAEGVRDALRQGLGKGGARAAAGPLAAKRPRAAESASGSAPPLFADASSSEGDSDDDSDASDSGGANDDASDADVLRGARGGGGADGAGEPGDAEGGDGSAAAAAEVGPEDRAASGPSEPKEAPSTDSGASSGDAFRARADELGGETPGAAEVVPRGPIHETPALAVAPPVFPEEARPFSLDDHDSTESLESIGMEALRDELAARGLKSGGSLRQRAERLFLLKSTPLAKIDRKHLAPRK